MYGFCFVFRVTEFLEPFGLPRFFLSGWFTESVTSAVAELNVDDAEDVEDVVEEEFVYGNGGENTMGGGELVITRRDVPSVYLLRASS